MSEPKAEVAVDHSHDRAFFFTFGGVLAALFGITFLIAIIAGSLAGDEDGEMNPLRKARVASNIEPVGGVYTDASAIPVAAPVEQAAARSPAQIVDGACAACHATGVLQATKFSDKAGWQARLDAVGGVDGLVASAIAGKGAMPARGGDASLSDDEVAAAVREMLSRAGL